MTGPVSPQGPAAEDPGKTLGIVGLVLSFFMALIGLIISIIGLVIAIIVAVVTFSTLMGTCDQLGPGVHREGGITYTCS